MNNGQTRHGFTLIELMVVVIIIAAIAGMVLPRVIPQSDKAKEYIAKGDMANISVGLKLYRLHNGSYPSNLKSLEDATKPGPYIDRPPNDPWKSPYRYSFQGEQSVPPYRLWSIGADKKDGNADDVSHWDN
jgi:general secretion pathway protein G